MRDTHRIKEKYELSLDNRQIVTLTLTGLIVLGGVFALGVVVGKKLAAEQGVPQPATDLLSAVDQKTTNLENMQKDASLTFQDELTRKAPVVEPSKPPEVKKPEPVKPEPAKPEPTDVKAELAQKLAEASRPPEDQTAPEVAKDPAKLSEAPDAAQPVPTRTNDAGALKEAFGKAQNAQPAKPAETAANGAWTLQLAAYQDRAEADRFAAGLRDKGYAPFIVDANIPGKGVWYRVRMGRFATKDAATRYLADFKRETSLPAIVAQ